MAWNYAIEIDSKTGFDGDSTLATGLGASFKQFTDRWLSDSAREVINLLPSRLKHLCATNNTFTAGTPEALNTGHVLLVTRNDGSIEQPCRAIQPEQVGRASDPDDINFATATDPVFFVKDNTLDVLPTGGTVSYSEVQYPSIIGEDTSISNFPDEAERAVVIGACIKAAEYMLANDEDVQVIIPILTQLREDYKREIEGL